MNQIDKIQTTNTNESVVNGEVVITALRQSNINNLSTGVGDTVARNKINEILEALRNVGIISRF